MSKLAKITFFLTTTITFITIGTVHYIQKIEKEKMHLGVIRDETRQAIRKQREKELSYQQEPPIFYEKKQPIISDLNSMNNNKNNV
ncbi:hypothetical protein PCANB_001906 [Pneumocystis canis]|nr:hypothetical protein PCK1_001699 [Pneumocystis canis]KAG5440336.1 hypothetical protein PCANB_001906 [Pneumocystis canis]